MIQITYKAVYTLLEKFYPRRSLNSFIEREIPENIFESSLLFAEHAEDYRYLDVMVSKRQELDKKYVFFKSITYDTPITIESNKHLNLCELAILSIKCPEIPELEFECLIEAQIDEQTKEAIDSFREHKKFLLEIPKEKGGY